MYVKDSRLPGRETDAFKLLCLLQKALFLTVKMMVLRKKVYFPYEYVRHGVKYTVYDSAFSQRSVAEIAQKAVDSPTESQFAKDYCRNKILEHIS